MSLVRSGLGSPLARCDPTESALLWNARTYEMTRQVTPGSCRARPDGTQKKEKSLDMKNDIPWRGDLQIAPRDDGFPVGM